MPEENTTWEQDYWKGAITQGLTENATASDIKRLLGSPNTYQYYCLITFCDIAKELYQINYDKDTRTISYYLPINTDRKPMGNTPTRSNATHIPHNTPPVSLNVPHLHESNKKDENACKQKPWSVTQVIQTYQKLASSIKSELKHIKGKQEDMDHAMTTYHTTLKAKTSMLNDAANNYLQFIEKQVNTGITMVKDTTKDGITIITETTREAMETGTLQLKEYIINAKSELQQSLNGSLEDLKTFTKDIMEKVKEETKELQTKIMDSSATTTPSNHTAKQTWEAVRREQRIIAEEKFSTTQNTNTADRKTTHWGPTGPTIHNNIQTVKQLPTLHTDKMIQHAKVPYSGREQAFYWYLSVKNSLHEYGILLIPLEEFLPGRCLCPQSYYGTTVEVEHYLIMTNALYLFLAKNDTHNDHTDITTRISKYAAEANGYTVLYEIMQLVHPLLNPYAKIERPTTTDSVDIHDYYSKLNTYFLYIKLKEKREFDPRTKAQYFIEGMDATYPTVK